jgi:hypothetical protein
VLPPSLPAGGRREIVSNALALRQLEGARGVTQIHLTRTNWEAASMFVCACSSQTKRFQLRVKRQAYEADSNSLVCRQTPAL